MALGPALTLVQAGTFGHCCNLHPRDRGVAAHFAVKISDFCVDISTSIGIHEIKEGSCYAKANICIYIGSAVRL